MPEGGKRTRETVVPLRIFAAPFLKAQLELIRLYIALSVVQGDCCAFGAQCQRKKISRGAMRRGNCLYSVPSQFSFKSFADGAVEEAKYYHNHAYYKRYYRAGRNAYA